MNNKLYVGNLPFRATSEDLQSLFAEVGTVESARVIDDRDTGRSRGFAFVEMSTGDEAQAAIEKFNGMEYDGRNLAVKEAQPREDNRGGGGGGGGRRNNYGGGGGGGRW